jgi:hypothetical protein
MTRLKLDLSALSVESFATLQATDAVNAAAPTIPPWCGSNYTYCPCTPRHGEA